jgi:hypothetical protein
MIEGPLPLCTQRPRKEAFSEVQMQHPVESRLIGPGEVDSPRPDAF